MLFIGDDWAEGHHDVVVQDAAGGELARRRLPEGADGIARFHELVSRYWGGDGEPDPAQVIVVTGTDRGPWVKALAAAGYRVCLVNPRQAARHKETVANSGKKDGFSGAGCLADMGRTRRHQMRELAAGSDLAGTVKVAARARQKLVWERTRHQLRMRPALREYFPAALEACKDLTLAGRDTLELLAKAPGPAPAAGLATAQVTAALKRAGRRGDLQERALEIRAALRAPHPGQPEVIAEAHAASVQASAAVIAALNEQVKITEAKVSGLFKRHPDAGACLSQPGMGTSPARGSPASTATPPPGTRRRRPAGTTPAPPR